MILMYHHLAAQAGFNTVAASAFAAQLDWLAQQGYRVVGMDAYVAAIQAGNLPPRTVAITFDDAYRSFEEIALPLLTQHGMPATVYVPTDHVGGANAWDDGAYPIMGWDALARMAAHPLVTLGSHGASHAHMRELTDAALAHEAQASRQALTQHLDIEPRHFAYPYGQLRDFDRRCMEAVAQAGYLSACSTLWGLSQSPSRRYALRRLEIEPVDDIARFSAKISRKLHPRALRQRVKNLLFSLHIRR